MDAYVQEVRKLENKFSCLEIHHVIWEHNISVDILSKLESTRAQVPAGIFVQELKCDIQVIRNIDTRFQCEKYMLAMCMCVVQRNRGITVIL
jgi:hypothetical protein